MHSPDLLSFQNKVLALLIPALLAAGAAHAA
ncbi:hypothetical protein, partial [Shigella sonnei]